MYKGNFFCLILYITFFKENTEKKNLLLFFFILSLMKCEKKHCEYCLIDGETDKSTWPSQLGYEVSEEGYKGPLLSPPNLLR